MMLDLPETIVEVPKSVLAWWSPDPRGILPLDGLRVTRSLRQSAKRYSVRVDGCFGEVIRRCADPSRDRAWITDEFLAASGARAVVLASASTVSSRASRCFTRSATPRRWP
jgi:Leu/Phe-tRNA-protein transferase